MMMFEIALSGIVGITLLLSAVPKLRHPGGFLLAVQEYRILPESLIRLFGWFIPPLELLVALFLLSGTAVGLAAMIASFLFACFLCAIGINVLRRRDIDCHCFGSTGSQRIGWKLLLQDGLLFCMSGYLAISVHNWIGLEIWSLFTFVEWLGVGSVAAIVLCLVVTGCAMVLLRITHRSVLHFSELPYKFVQIVLKHMS